jgi:Cu/Ag efflux protein CusF
MSPSLSARFLGAWLLLTVAPAFGASRLPADPGTAHDAPSLQLVQAQAAEPSKIFPAVGVVTAKSPDGSLTINHQTIEGLMPAMEMMFSVKPRSLSTAVRPGDKVEFNVVGKTYTIVAVKVVGHVQ